MLKKLTGLAIAAGLAGAMMLSAGSASAERLVFMTGPAGGSWYPLGAAIKNIVEQDVSGTTVDIRPGASLLNLRAVPEGKADLGMDNVTTTVDDVNGHTPLVKHMTGLSHLAHISTQSATPTPVL